MHTDWRSTNWQLLLKAIAVVEQILVRYNQSANNQVIQAPDTIDLDIAAFPALNRLATTFNLSHFECLILLTCAGMELDAGFALLCGEAQGDLQRSFPTLNLMMAIFPNAQWTALTPIAPLRHWRMIEIAAGQTLMHSPLRIDERILHYLAGEAYLDTHFQGILHSIAPARPLVPSHQQIANRIVTLWQTSQNLPIVQLYGRDAAGKQAIAATTAALLRQPLYSLSGRSLPLQASELQTLLLLWQREVQLQGGLLLLNCEGIDSNDHHRLQAIAQFLDNLDSPVIVTSRDRDRALFSGVSLSAQRPLITLEVNPPQPAEQRFLWQTALAENLPAVNGWVDTLVSQFNLNAPAIAAVCAEAVTQPPATSLTDHLWDLCRLQAQPDMDDLAQRIEATATWEDLVLPEAQMRVLRAVAAHVRQRTTVYDRWGFQQKSNRGLGISGLFAGPSGTGKTMAAEVLANELRLDLYRIDLSAVVSKYIGETEKNLRRVFDAADAGSAVLLFDEADALFGKRSEVKDSHDRYANMEVSYLLQRMEAYQGLAILTTNMKEAIDTAFLRRIRFIVKFPFPDAAQREEIWRRVFPQSTPTAELDLGKLARLNVAGGNIRNIALNAAFLAADAQTPVGMQHLLEAAHSEYAKLERTLTDAEVRGWI